MGLQNFNFSYLFSKLIYYHHSFTQEKIFQTKELEEHHLELRNSLFKLNKFSFGKKITSLSNTDVSYFARAW